MSLLGRFLLVSLPAVTSSAPAFARASVDTYQYNAWAVVQSGTGAKSTYTYDAVGPVKDVAGSYGNCKSTNTRTVSHQPWATSFLKIDGDLRHYDAAVKTDGEHYMATYFCTPAGSFTTDVQFIDLETFVGLGQTPTMAPDATELKGHGTSDRLHHTFSWNLAAVVPQ